MSVLLYVHQKREDFPLSLYLSSQQGNTPLSLILLSILSVSLLHSAVPSHPSCLVGKGELWIQKTQTYTTEGVLFSIRLELLLRSTCTKDQLTSELYFSSILFLAIISLSTFLLSNSSRCDMSSMQCDIVATMPAVVALNVIASPLKSNVLTP